MKLSLLLPLLALSAALTANAAPIAQKHQIKGLQCEACHTVMPQADVKKCLMCHGPKEKLAEKPEQHKPLKTVDMPCTICHQGHQ
jgi:rRNA maturation endonuclease Nob1